MMLVWLINVELFVFDDIEGAFLNVGVVDVAVDILDDSIVSDVLLD